MNVNTNVLSEFLDFWHFYDDFMVFGDGSLGCGFKLKGKDISCETVSEINTFNQKLEDMVSSIEEGLNLQVFYRLSPNVDKLISAHEGLSKSYPDKTYGPILKSRSDFMRKNQERGHYFKPEVYLFLRSKSLSYKSRGVFSKEKSFTRASEEEFQKHSKAFEKTVNQLSGNLVSLGIMDKELEASEWTKLIYEHFNLSRSEKLKSPKIRPPQFLKANSLSSQLLLTDMHLYKNFLEIGSYQFKTISLKSLPEETHSGLIDRLLKLSFHCSISQTMKMCNQSGEQKRLGVKRRLNHSMASGSANVSDLQSEANLNQIEGLLSELVDSSQKIVEADLNIIIWGETERELEDKEDEVLRALKGLEGAEGIVETYANFDAFIKLTPGLCRMNRPKKLKSTNFAHLLPVYSYWEGNSNPVCLLPNRDNVLTSIDPFSKELPNWNGFIIGSSGSGKSFTLNSLILMFIGDQGL
jgi:type IV secretory pathway VirB4 component